ncbi:MAG: hypothetical protein R2932_44350 [Caldilineaceae bacterium]
MLGDNADGQVGDGSDFVTSAVLVVGLNSASKHSQRVAIIVAPCWKVVRCAVGDAIAMVNSVMVQPMNDSCRSQSPVSQQHPALAGGEAHTCALFAGGAISCWGATIMDSWGSDHRFRYADSGYWVSHRRC